MTDDWTIDLNHLTATHANGMIFQFAPHPEGGADRRKAKPRINYFKNPRTRH